MALKEPYNSILASSLDNFYIFNNPNYQPNPYVTFTINSTAPTMITIEDKSNAENYKLTISGSPTNYVSTNTFRTSTSVQSTMYSFIECLKKNSILFYDIEILSEKSFKIHIDTTRTYSIYCNNSAIGISGTYSSYNSAEFPKFTMIMQGEIDENTNSIMLDKYNNNKTVSFNVTAPFQNTSFYKPITCALKGFFYFNGETVGLGINRALVKVLPTTLTKFEDVDYSEYYYDAAQNVPKKFLTNGVVKKTNYNELMSLSLLCNTNVSLLFKFYTNSGMFLTSKTNYISKEVNDIRTDFLFTFDLDEVENKYNHQVGYVEVVAMNGGTEITNAIRYVVDATCKQNNVIYFLNKLGGVDSYNFREQETYNSQIDNNVTSFSNPIDYFDDVYEIERKISLKNSITYTLKDTVDKKTGLWLNELSKSKYVFRIIDGKKYMIIIEQMTINLNSKDDRFDIQLKYRFSDNSLQI